MCCSAGSNGVPCPFGLMKVIGSRDIHTIPWLSGSISTSTQPTSLSSHGSWHLSPFGKTYSMYGRTMRLRLRLSNL